MAKQRNLIERLLKIARIEGIPESRLILDEVKYFLKSHKGHGNYDVELNYNNRNSRLDYIRLICGASNLVHTEKCPHHNPNTCAELRDSIVYSRKEGCEEEYQAERRAERAKKSKKPASLPRSNIKPSDGDYDPGYR